MTREACLAHQTLTGHTSFYREDPLSSTGWLCSTCSPHTCQAALSLTSYCHAPVIPGTAFCPAHFPLAHLLTPSQDAPSKASTPPRAPQTHKED